MARNQKDFTYDNALLLKDAGLIAASLAATVASAAAVLDLGAARMDGRVIVDITAAENASNDERYLIKTQFSNSSTFVSGVFGGTALDVGASAITKDSASTAVGRYEIPFTNEINGARYRYMRLFTEVQGTIATGVNYTAFAVLGAR